MLGAVCEAPGALRLLVFSALFVLVAGVLLDNTSIVELTCELVVATADEVLPVDDDADADELDATLDELPPLSVLEMDVPFSMLMKLRQRSSVCCMGGTTYVYSAQSKRRSDALLPCSAVITKVCSMLLNPVWL